MKNARRFLLIILVAVTALVVIFIADPHHRSPPWREIEIDVPETQPIQLERPRARK